MATREQGNNVNYARVSAEAWLKLTGESGFINLGNVVMSKFAPEIQRKEHKAAVRGGTLRRDREDVIEASEIYEVELDEEFVETNRLRLYGTAGANDVQSALTAPNGTAQFTAKKRRWFDVGKRKISSVVVSVSASNKTVDVDYKVDADLGMIYIMEGGSIADDATVDVTFACAAHTMATQTDLTTLKFTGTFRYVESDQESDAVRERREFPCEVTVTQWGERKADDFSKYTIRVLRTGTTATTSKYRQ